MIKLNQNGFIKFIYSILFLLFAIGCTANNDYDELASQATITALELENERLRNNREDNQPPSEQATSTPQATFTPEQSVQEPENMNPDEQNSDSSDEEDEVGNITIPDPVPTPDEDALFFDDFSNNDNGWNLGIVDGGSVSFTNYGLTIIHSESDKCIFVETPNFDTPDNYSIETTIYVNDLDKGHFGFAFGGKTYGVGYDGRNHIVHIWDGQGSHDVKDEAFWGQNSSFSLRMDVSRGNYSLVVNDDPLSTTQFIPTGNTISLFSCRWRLTSGSNQQVSFDNVRISE
ncbi:hypothetical protein [Candidatus Leptofilum sp.]|uniref:hypothetical protein n=1 Tax=Candidatus Leptofilum sp. TaxID=3241576 RepID=UPI003B596F3A